MQGAAVRDDAVGRIARQGTGGAYARPLSYRM